LKIAEAVVELLTKQDFYTKCAIAAKKRVLAFSSETIAGQYLEIYDHILKVGLI
jgi:glycosyltransferase involved in cell wall biosynthesis